MDSLCIIIPAKNEEDTIKDTIAELYNSLNIINFLNILVVNDYSIDNTANILNDLTKKYPNLKTINNNYTGGVGNAIKYGIENSEGTVIAICMADGSDSAANILESYNLIRNHGYDCVFGSRFIKGGEVTNYPYIKLIMNRIFNNSVDLFMKNNYNDYTNIFKVYRRTIINEIIPINSEGFSIGLEMSLKSYNIGANIKVIPISWKQRIAGKSKLSLIKNIKEYMAILIKNRN